MPFPSPPPTATVRRAAAVACLLITLALVVFAIRHTDRPSRPGLLPAGGTNPSRAVRGFDEIGFRVTGPPDAGAAPGQTHCALLARTAAQQRQGLMHRHDLAGYDGMLFQFDGAVEVGFYMKDTLLPLSIAWFDSSGRYLTSTTMTPCPQGAVTCPSYFANAPYHLAIEVPAGGLARLGIGAGSTLTTVGPC
jgi:uncharacterized membrane protein (UPF0127 family)